MPYSDYPPGTIAARGKEIYQQQIREKVEPQHKGKFLSVDIETGDYEIDTDDLSPSLRLLAKRPEAVIYSLRIGFRAAHRIGFKFSSQKQ
ncbi:MAG: hypothetical protein OYL97_00985 [Candidatus Poribacteria bacterium]|nr:hypothetical protein [Candidatus Poribacteria bacterium]MDD9973383.1 hypothetical protein [Candidatus Poribacteria bacterium]MDE0327251.1 hypothetical protein [Candidatus Poribacteria bacterium]MDE0465601.1 hypothetical protein [Candidatus Poribacteria bacterium]